MISRANARAKALGDDLGAVTGTSLDKGVELDALAKMEPGERKTLIERENVTVRCSANQRLPRSPKYGASGVALLEIVRQHLNIFQLVTPARNSRICMKR